MQTLPLPHGGREALPERPYSSAANQSSCEKIKYKSEENITNKESITKH